MKNFLKVSIPFLFLVVFAGCTRTLPIHNIENQTVSYNLSLNEVEKAILKGGMEKGWTMTVSEPGRIDANIIVRKHKAETVISYNEHSYSITYHDSMNLLYDSGKIHKSYNKWITYLNQRIQINLLEASSQ